MEKKKSSPINKTIAVSKNDSEDFDLGTDNIFADLGLPNPEEELAKAKLATEIFHIIKQKKLTQVKAAGLLGVDQAKVSALMTGKLSGFSMERLFRFLNDLGQDVAIKVKPKSHTRKKGSTTVGTYCSLRREIDNTSRSPRSQVYAIAAKKNR
jgi:predicted XRE-type DNA-binding protein